MQHSLCSTDWAGCRWNSGARTQVAAMMEIERYSHVMHISSTVEGELLPELGVWDVLRAALPAGTISGAPKVSNLEITLRVELQMLCAQLQCWQSVQLYRAGYARMMRHNRLNVFDAQNTLPAIDDGQGSIFSARACKECLSNLHSKVLQSSGPCTEHGAPAAGAGDADHR